VAGSRCVGARSARAASRRLRHRHLWQTASAIANHRLQSRSIANQNSDNIVLFRLDPSSGVLTREGDPISVEGKPRCIKFRPC
jgi:hypothetical protein